MRAIANLEKDPLRRNPDDLARRFLTGRSRLGALPGIRHFLKWHVGRHLAPGMIEYHVARTRFIDRVFEQGARDFRQLVLLGAGLDTRAFRFAASLQGRLLYEVDRQQAVAAKERRARRVCGVTPTLRYVACDFDLPGLPADLAQRGWDVRAPTFYLAEGLFYYLRPDSVDRLLQAISTSPSGSRLVFDYVRRDTRDRPGQIHGAAGFLRSVMRMGEPVLSVLDSRELAELLDRHGFRIEQHFCGAELADAVWPEGPPPAMPRLCEAFGVVVAVK